MAIFHLVLLLSRVLRLYKPLMWNKLVVLTQNVVTDGSFPSGPSPEALMTAKHLRTCSPSLVEAYCSPRHTTTLSELRVCLRRRQILSEHAAVKEFEQELYISSMAIQRTLPSILTNICSCRTKFRSGVRFFCLLRQQIRGLVYETEVAIRFVKILVAITSSFAQMLTLFCSHSLHPHRCSASECVPAAIPLQSLSIQALCGPRRDPKTIIVMLTTVVLLSADSAWYSGARRKHEKATTVILGQHDLQQARTQPTGTLETTLHVYIPSTHRGR